MTRNPPRSAKSNAGDRKGVSENASRDALSGRIGLFGRAIRPARSTTRGSEAEIAWKAAFGCFSLTGGKPNGECRMKFFRIIFFYGLYFILCMIVVTAALQEWSAGAQMLFAFGVPVLLVWWQEKRRSRKTAAKALAKTGDEQKAPSPPPPRSNRIAVKNGLPASVRSRARALPKKRRLLRKPMCRRNKTILKLSAQVNLQHQHSQK